MYYIGRSIQIENRWTEHVGDLNNNRHCNPILQKSWNKYGKDAFNFEIICECSEENIVDKEQEYLKIMFEVDKDRIFNILEDAKGGRTGIPMSVNSKIKLSNALKEKYNDPIYKEKRRKMQDSESYRRKLSESHKGLKASEESKQKRRGANNKNYDPTIYTFINTHTGMIEKGITKYQMQMKYQLRQSSISSLFNGKLKSTNGWSLMN